LRFIVFYLIYPFTASPIASAKTANPSLSPSSVIINGGQTLIVAPAPTGAKNNNPFSIEILTTLFLFA
jgi:hypothetical protein